MRALFVEDLELRNPGSHWTVMINILLLDRHVPTLEMNEGAGGSQLDCDVEVLHGTLG